MKGEVMVHNFNSSAPEAEAGDLGGRCQPGIHRETLFAKKKKKTKMCMIQKTRVNPILSKMNKS